MRQSVRKSTKEYPLEQPFKSLIFRVVFILFQCYPFDIFLRHPGVEISDKLSVFMLNGLKQERNGEHMRGVIVEEIFKLAMGTRKRDIKRKDTSIV